VKNRIYINLPSKCKRYLWRIWGERSVNEHI